MSSEAFAYCGSELELFARAHRWKAYLASQVEPYLGETVLEVGAGLGATTRALCRRPRRRWVCLEPDAALAARCGEALASGGLPSGCEVVVGSIDDAPKGPFDSVIYIDVLEHIEHDRSELERAAAHLAPGGYLVVLSPAHQWLYSEFDRAIGHFRRYNERSLRALQPEGLVLVRLRYLDSAGAMTSAANRLFLRQSLPTSAQIGLWDRALVGVSRWIDPLTGFRVGRTLLAVWTVPHDPFR